MIISVAKLNLGITQGITLGITFECLEDVWTVSRQCLECVWGCLEGVWKVSGRCPEGVKVIAKLADALGDLLIWVCGCMDSV